MRRAARRGKNRYSALNARRKEGREARRRAKRLYKWIATHISLFKRSFE